MKIVLFVHCFLPKHFYGTEVYTLQLAKNLLESGYDVTVVSANFPFESKCEKIITFYHYEDVPVYCIDKTNFPYTRIKDTYYQPVMHDVLKELLIKLSPDLVHVTHLINHTAVLLEVTKELGVPTVATLTDFFGICYTSQLKAAGGSLCSGPNRERTNCVACRLMDETAFPHVRGMRKLLGKYPWSIFYAAALNYLWKLSYSHSEETEALVADLKERPDILLTLYKNYRAVIAPTRFLSQAYIANGLKVPIHISHFGVDSNRSLKPYRNPDKPLVFAFIGQIYPHKGTDILIKAFRSIPAGRAELLVYGKDDQSPEYTAKLKKMSKGLPVFFRGTFPQTEIDAVLAAVDFLVIPSIWYENSPLVLLNALASHTPVIVSDVAGMTEFVNDGRNGFVFKRGCVNDLERVLLKIVADPVAARRLSETTDYQRTTRMMTEDVISIYMDILNV